MRPGTWSAFAAFVALAGLELAVAEEEPPVHTDRPKYYFPKEIKRAIQSGSSNQQNPWLGPSNLESWLLGDGNNQPATPTTNNNNNNNNGNGNGNRVVIIDVTESVDRKGHTHTITGATHLGAQVTAARTEILVTKTTAAAAKGQPAKAKPAKAEPTETEKKQPAADTTTKKKAADPTEKKQPADTKATPAATSESGNGGGLLGGGGILGEISSLAGEILGGGSTTTTTTKDAASKPTEVSQKGKDGEDGKDTTTTTTTTSSDGGLVGGLGSGLGSVLGGVGSDLSDLGLGGKATATTTTTTSASNPKVPVDGKTTKDGKDTTTTTTTTTSSDGGLVGGLGSGLGSVLGGVGSDLSDLGLGGKATTTTTTTSASNPKIPVSVPAATTPTTSALNPLAPIESWLGLGSSSPSTTSTTSSTSIPGLVIPTPSLPGSGGSSSSIIPGSSSATGVPTSSGKVPFPSGSVHPDGAGSGTTSSTSTPTPTHTPTDTAPTTTTTSTTTKEPETTPRPTDQTTSSNDWVGPSILHQPQPTHTEDNNNPTSTDNDHEPTALPGSISPGTEVSSPPENSLLIQLGFNQELPWSFVATTSMSSAQIFQYVPEGLEHALSILQSQVTMFALEPYYSWKTTGYNATLAMAYIQRSYVDKLRNELHNPNSRLYNQPSEPVKTLFSMIDPTIPLIVGQEGSSSTGTGTTGSGDNSDNSNGKTDSNTNGGSASSSKTKVSSVGIGCGVVAGAAAYGAGMFWLARRYRQKRQLHRRSVSTVEQMSQGGSAAGSVFAAGARMSGSQAGSGRSGQMISAPVMAENSLGWN